MPYVAYNLHHSERPLCPTSRHRSASTRSWNATSAHGTLQTYELAERVVRPSMEGGYVRFLTETSADNLGFGPLHAARSRSTDQRLMSRLKMSVPPPDGQGTLLTLRLGRYAKPPPAHVISDIRQGILGRLCASERRRKASGQARTGRSFGRLAVSSWIR